MERIFKIKYLAMFLLIPFLNGCGASSGSISVLPSLDQFKQSTNADIKIDILFVIDDSGSMSQEQQDLFNNFKNFISLFYDKGFDFRVAVTKTSAFGTAVNCKLIASPFTTKTCTAAEYASGAYISTETGLTPKEFRCGFGNNCGVNGGVGFQTQVQIAGTTDPDAPANDPAPQLKATVGNGTPAQGTDHILASSNLTKTQMIDKFKKNIVAGLNGTGDERGIESAETVIRNMKQFYPDPAKQFPRPNSHLAVIHLGDEGDGPLPNDIILPATTSTALYGSNRGGSSTTSTLGSLRSTFINSNPSYAPIVLVVNNNLFIADHLTSVRSYLNALKSHHAVPVLPLVSTATVSVHAIEDLPNSSNIPVYLSAASFDGLNSASNTSGNGIGYFQAYMAVQAGGLVLSKSSPFGPSLSLLGDTISSLASFFTLSETLDALAISNLKVYVEGINSNNPIPNNATNGYQYDQLTNRITFFGSMIPPQGAFIGTIYTCATFNCQ